MGFSRLYVLSRCANILWSLRARGQLSCVVPTRRDPGLITDTGLLLRDLVFFLLAFDLFLVIILALRHFLSASLLEWAHVYM